MSVLDTMYADIHRMGLYNYITTKYKSMDGVHLKCEITDVIASIPVEDLEFSARPFNCLKRDLANTVGDIADRINSGRLGMLRNIGIKSEREIYDKFLQCCWNHYSSYQRENFILYLIQNNKEVKA